MRPGIIDSANRWAEPGKDGRSPPDVQHFFMSKCLMFNYSVDVSDLLSDKATSTWRSSSFENFDRTAYRAYYDRQPPNTSRVERRVIPQYLFHTNVSVKEVIDRVEAGTVPFEDKCLTAVSRRRSPKSPRRGDIVNSTTRL